MKPPEIPAKVKQVSEELEMKPEPLKGDASVRDYFRLRKNRRSVVLSFYRENVKDLQKFLRAHGFLGSRDFNTPEIIKIEKERKIIVMEDLGEKTLYDRIESGDISDLEKTYKKAIDEIVKLRQIPVKECLEGVIPEKGLQKKRLTEELNFMRKHFLEGLCDLSLGATQKDKLKGEFNRLSTALDSLPEKLCHRDYHSRNLFLKNGEIYWIDYQDLMTGPGTYDPASLLRDSYINLDRSTENELLSYYLTHAGLKKEPEQIREDFEQTALQRNLKALGTFAFQKTEKDNDAYLEFVEPTLKKALRALKNQSLTLNQTEKVIKRCQQKKKWN